MLDDKSQNPGGAASDPLLIGSKIAGIEPVRQRRGDGAILESKALGRLEYVSMRHGRPSFWHGVQPSTAHPLGLKIICEVDGDDPPGADHAACLVAIRRRHLKDVAACLPLIQRRLSEMRLPTDIAAEDLRLVGVHLCAKPMITARQVLEYRAALVPMLLFLVVFLHGKPASLHIERRL